MYEVAPAEALHETSTLLEDVAVATTFAGAVTLLHELVTASAHSTPDAAALTADAETLNYGTLQTGVCAAAAGLLDLGLLRGQRVAIWLDKRVEGVIASFAAAAAGGVFVPINPLLKPDQVGYILRDCNVRTLVTSPERLALLIEVLGQCLAVVTELLKDRPRDVLDVQEHPGVLAFEHRLVLLRERSQFLG